ncbi:hypothetical protein KFZ73_12325 [Tsukamurella paurometabola]|uniref:Membrane-bound metal-dependent hydrolase n=1 Tax=Tsukamurella paurometabola TaxID=2061 RepID=A0ABS5NDJ0_TSUPA|nr:hypothetical protein [Tsukamurella paurometabola]
MLSAVTVRALPPRTGAVAAAAGLVKAAVIYPASRHGRSSRDKRESAVVAASAAVMAAAAFLPTPRAHVAVALAWLSHAAFDAVYHHTPSDTALPDWYPALCAGYDVGLGAALLAPRGT